MCDVVWKETKEKIKVSEYEKWTKGICEDIVDKAMLSGSNDNLSCVFIAFKHYFNVLNKERCGKAKENVKKVKCDNKLIESVRQGLGKPNRLYLLDVEVSNDTLNELAYKNKKASTEPPVEAKQVMQKANLKKTNITNITQDESNSNTNIENNTKKEESIKINNVKKSFVPNFKLNPKIHKGLSTNFLNYGTDEELEQMLLENQRKKYRE